LAIFEDASYDDKNRPNEPSESLELIPGLTFTSWDEFKNWINRFALKEGFDYKIRTKRFKVWYEGLFTNVPSLAHIFHRLLQI